MEQSIQDQFREAVKRHMPEEIYGVKMHSVDYGEKDAPNQDAVVVAIYFLFSFDENGRPVDRPLTDLTADWKQVSLFVAASGREIRMAAHDLDGLAQRRIESAIAQITANDPLFAKMAA